jgi:hypothetical protein
MKRNAHLRESALLCRGRPRPRQLSRQRSVLCGLQLQLGAVRILDVAPRLQHALHLRAPFAYQLSCKSTPADGAQGYAYCSQGRQQRDTDT